MSDTYTAVTMLSGEQYLVRGSVTRDEAIAETRLHYERVRRAADAILNTPPDALIVQHVHGLHRQRLLRELLPATARRGR